MLVDLDAGEVESFRRLCRDQLTEQGETPDPEIASQVAMLCAQSAAATDDWSKPLKLAERAVAGAKKPSDRWQRLVIVGAALVRAGRFESAIEKLEEAIKLRGDNGTETYGEEYWLALAQHQLGRSKEAQERLIQADALMRQVLPIDFKLIRLQKEVQQTVAPVPART